MNSPQDNDQAPMERINDENTPVGDVLDRASPEYPEEKKTVSWTPNDSDTTEAAD